MNRGNLLSFFDVPHVIATRAHRASDLIEAAPGRLEFAGSALCNRGQGRPPPLTSLDHHLTDLTTQLTSV
jgi:hypothetical protein